MPALPFETLPAGRPDPRILVQRQFEQASKQLDIQYENKYQELNQKYDWNRYDRNPDEIDRIRGMLRNQIEGQKRKLQMQYKQQTDQFDLIDRTLGPEQAEQAKWRMIAGPDIAGRMFPKPVDPRAEYHANLRLRSELLNEIAAYTLDPKGKLYQSKTDEKGYYLDKIDKSMPASEAEYQGWLNSITALESAKRYKAEQIMPGLTTADILPTRLQELMLEQQEKSWRRQFTKKFAKGYFGLTVPGMLYKSYKTMKEIFTPESPGTFADKVTATMGRPIAERPVREPTEKITRKQLLTEYRRLGGSQTAEGREFADSYLR